MSLIKYNPRRNIPVFRSPFDSFLTDPFFSSFFKGTGNETKTWQPVVDIFEENDTIAIKADLPGMKKEDISINVENRVLTIQGERSHEEEVKEENYYRKERSFGSFHRSFTLPDDVNSEMIKAEYKDGILKVNIPKPVKAETKQITIK